MIQLNERILEITKELESLKEEKNKLISEKVKSTYTNTFWKYDNEYFQVKEIRKVYVDESSFECSGINISINNGSIYYSQDHNTEFGWGKVYSGWEPSTKEELISTIENQLKALKALL